MKNVLNPKWLILIHALPAALLFFIYYGEFNIIKSLLEEETLELWYNFGGTLFLLSIIHVSYMLFCIVQKKELSLYYALTALPIYSTYLYVYSHYSYKLIPRSIPRWMLSRNTDIYLGTFLMPTLAFALFIIVIKLTSMEKNQKAWKSFLLSLSVPLIAYIFAQLILPLWKPVSYKFEKHVFIILGVIAIVLFLFFLIRSIYILSINKGEKWKHLYLASKFAIGIICPLIGLGLSHNINGPFGDFSSPWFFGIALANGILMCLPPFEDTRHRLLLYIGRCITFSFSFYFFIVFLPFLPLSVVAIIAIGIGILMLSPLALFIIHIQELSRDYSFLKNHFSKKTLITIAIIGFIIIPSALTLSYKNDRTVLHDTLDYVYAPDYAKDYNINKKSLKKTIAVVSQNRSRNSSFFMSSQTPYLAPYFNWLVLDNLTLSNAKIKTIESIFFKSEPFKIRPERLRNKGVELSNISSNSTYNEDDKSWTSWIDLEITNANENNFTSEYATTINLPNGCWINNYYLYVGDKKEMGILAEKKSAMWIFSQIRNINRDPGLLHYLTGNKVSFRVFPFAKNEIRKTGIQFIHKDPVTITIDDHKLVLGEEKTATVKTEMNAPVAYISAKEKEDLQKVKRTPYYHFIVDTSKGKDSITDDYIKTVRAFLGRNDLKAKNAKLSFTNTYTATQDFKDDWTNDLKAQNFEGGFYLERAIKKTLFNVYTNPSDSYPIIIVVTDNMLDAIVSKNFADFKITYPESHLFYHLNTLGYLASHNLDKNPKHFIKDNTTIAFNNDVLAWPNTNNPKGYLPNNNQPSIILNVLNFELNPNSIASSNWNTGLQMQGKWLSGILYPKAAESNWNNAVEMSFNSRIMTPLTSYIVVETEAQKAVLLKKQKELLAGKKSLDLNEQTQRMSEPKFILVFILFGGFLFMRRKHIF
ncbi:MAG: MSEP-CTERM sorting domain-containing protein [Algibacter sp.]